MLVNTLFRKLFSLEVVHSMLDYANLLVVHAITSIQLQLITILSLLCIRTHYAHLDFKLELRVLAYCAVVVHVTKL